MTRKITIVAIVAMLAMGTSAALALGASPQATDAAMEQETTTAVGQTTTAAGTANVTFQNQTSNGSAVVVERVVVPEGGFIAIHEAETAEAGAQTEVGTETEMVTETEAGVQTTTVTGEAVQRYTAGAVIGNSTYLEPGVHTNVTIQLDQQLEESQVLIAMPHLDTNDNQQYDFPEADDPYTQAGQPVTDWANVTVEAGAAVTTTAAGAQTTTEEM